MKMCTKCKVEKDLSEYYLYMRKMRDGSKKQYYKIYCKECDKIKAKEQRFKNDYNKKYNARENVRQRKLNWEKEKLKDPIYADKKRKYRQERYIKNIEKIKQYNANPINKQRRREQAKEKRQIPSNKLRRNVSKSIHEILGKNGKYRLIFNMLGYSELELKQHLEKQFESWMSWENYGQYDANKWDDNNPLTWKWQLDHIIPHSTFNYTSPNDEDFKKCWALENLRPYSAKQNILDGTRRTRHKKV